MSVIRGTSLHGYPALTRELGADPEALLASVHLDVECTDDPDRFIDYRSVVAALELAAARTRHGDFGRTLARRQGIEILGPVGIAGRTAETVGAALAAVERYLSVYSPALTIGIEPVPDSQLARFTWAISADRPPPHAQAAELGIGAAIRIFTMLSGPDFTPTMVSFPHAATTSLDAYAADYGCRVELEATYAGFTFPASFLARPVASDGVVHKVVRDYLDGLLVATPADVVGQVRILVRRTLATATASLDQTAHQLALAPRTLQRRLAAEGFTFEDLLDEVRRDEAERLLATGDLPLMGVARALGYSEQSVLTRSCRRWYGVSPSELRARLRREGEART